MAMVKADAYGHGMEECAAVFSNCGAAAFGVAEVVEGVRLRQAGFVQPIYILAGLLPEFFDAIIDYDLTPVLVDAGLVDLLAQAAQRRNQTLAVHLKVDAGMGRQGCLPSAAADVIDRIQRTSGLQLAGIMAHFPMADDSVGGNSRQVLADFLRVMPAVAMQHPQIKRHIANSGGIFTVAGAQLDMVRPGIALYGYGPSSTWNSTLPGNGDELQPAMSFVSRVIQLREVPAGTGLGYGHIFTTTRTTRLAVLPVGYEDGYARDLSNRAVVLLHGRRVPVVGRISMNLTLLDVTEISSVKPGDEVVLLGRQGSERITADDIAGWRDTISYEILCLFGHCNRKEYAA